jgi:FAD/FMN-containing dehydrogenase
LGIITSITFQCEPLQIYRQVKEITHFDDLVANFEKWDHLACHFKAWWFPETDHVQIWSTQYASPEEIKLYVENKKEITEFDNRIVESDFSDSIGELVEKMGNDTLSPNVKSGRFETVLRFREQKSLLGNQYQLWCKGIPGSILL